MSQPNTTPESRMGLRWSEEDDRRLIAWGSCFGNGFAYVAEHDLGRAPRAGVRRAAFLRRTKPEWVRKIVEELDHE